MKANEVDPVIELFRVRDEKRLSRLISSGRPRLTLRHLNALRKMREVKRMRNAQSELLIKAMYGSEEENSKKT